MNRGGRRGKANALAVLRAPLRPPRFNALVFFCWTSSTERGGSRPIDLPVRQPLKKRGERKGPDDPKTAGSAPRGARASECRGADRLFSGDPAFFAPPLLPHQQGMPLVPPPSPLYF